MSRARRAPAGNRPAAAHTRNPHCLLLLSVGSVTLTAGFLAAGFCSSNRAREGRRQGQAGAGPACYAPNRPPPPPAPLPHASCCCLSVAHLGGRLLGAGCLLDRGLLQQTMAGEGVFELCVPTGRERTRPRAHRPVVARPPAVLAAAVFAHLCAGGRLLGHLLDGLLQGRKERAR